jgi:hypothetical protein
MTPVDWPTWTTAAFTVVIAIATVVLAIATIRLWVSTNRLAEGAEQTSQRQLRAYVSVRPLTVLNFVSGEKIRVSLRVLNHGQVPASNMHSNYRIELLPPNPLNRHIQRGPENQKDTVEFSVFPRDRGTLVFHSDFLLSEDDRKAVLSGSKHIHVWGVTTYDDGFAAQRTTRFDVSTGGEKPSTYWNYGHGHNAST